MASMARFFSRPVWILLGIHLIRSLIQEHLILLPLAALIVWLLHRVKALQGSAGVPPAARSGRDSHATLFRSLLFLGISLALSFVAIDYIIDRGAFLLHFGQSWSSHFASAKSFEYGSANDHPFDWSIFLKNWDTSVPALVGVGLLPALYSSDRMSLGSPSLRLSPPRSAGERVPGGGARAHCGSAGRTVVAMVPLAWLTLTLIVFATHKPWWSYYYVHIAIPLCGCAVIGVEAAWRRIHRRRHLGLSLLLRVFAVWAVGWMGSRVYLQISGIRHSPQTYSSLVLGEIQRLKAFARFLYIDESIYSFHAGIPMPPDLAVLPLKRLWSGDLTNARVAEEMQTIKPEVILLRNDAREVPFQELIDAEYRVVYQDADHRLYTTKALAKQAGY